jgi:hypothetical protein
LAVRVLSARAMVASSSTSTWPALTAWPSMTWMALTVAVSIGWISLLPALGTILPLRHGDDVDVAEAGPQQRDQGEGHQQPGDDARRGRDRGFLKFQRGGEEGGLVRQARRRVEFAADLPDVAEDRGIAAQQVEGGLQAEGEGLGHEERP